ncbi:MAG: ATP-binding protein [Mycoplasmatales bacterium]
MIDIRPNVGKTIESLKSSGYDIYFAIADIIDNSLDAQATSVSINVNFDENTILICDNGIGMNKETMIEALRLGSETGKNRNNLGKFGFGLKSASFSQANKIVVASKKENITNEITFDVGKSVQQNEWIAFESNEIINKLSEYKTGTVVKWNDLYRLGVDKIEINEKLDEVCNNLIYFLGKTFYVYIDEGIEFDLNGIPIESISPFYEKNATSRNIDTQTFEFGEDKITINAYDISKVQKRNSDNNLIESQGIYVFRNKRFIKNIGWLSITKHPTYNLLRVKLDVGANEDDLLNIDFKKSNVEIPNRIKQEIRKFENNIVKIQRKNQKIIGKKKLFYNQTNINYVYTSKDKLNANHIFINNFLCEKAISMNDLNEFLCKVKRMDDIANTPKIKHDDEEFLFDLLEELKKSFENKEEFYSLIYNTSPFKENIEIVENFRRIYD